MKEDFDEPRAEAVCGAICRDLLGDFAPALLLLSSLERQRVQAILAYASTLFDFARQAGSESERLAQINWWEMTLETALSGEPVGRPVFVRMGREQRRRAWLTPALDELVDCARRRVVRSRPATPEEADAQATREARAAAAALLGQEPPGEVAQLLGALMRLRMLQLPLSGLPDGGEDPGGLLAAVHRECARLRQRLLRAPRGLAELSPGYRRALVFCLLASLRLLSGLEDGGIEVLKKPPQLGVLTRLKLLARARWLSEGGKRTRTSTD